MKHEWKIEIDSKKEGVACGTESFIGTRKEVDLKVKRLKARYAKQGHRPKITVTLPVPIAIGGIADIL